jgi:hypothetical protein
VGVGVAVCPKARAAGTSTKPATQKDIEVSSNSLLIDSPFRGLSPTIESGILQDK